MVDGNTEFFPAEEVFDAPTSVMTQMKQDKVIPLESMPIPDSREEFASIAPITVDVKAHKQPVEAQPKLTEENLKRVEQDAQKEALPKKDVKG